MKRILLALLLLPIISLTFAQKSAGFIIPTGNFSVEKISKNVIKVVYNPNGYTKNENVTAAVLPQTKSNSSITAILQNEALLIHDLVKLSAFQNVDNYAGFDIELQPDERIYGGGERALPLNRRGFKFALYNGPWYGYGDGADNLNFSVPFFTSSRGYGVFFDNGSKGFADIGKFESNVFRAGFSSGQLVVYFIFGNNYREILTHYHQLTGLQPLPPRWALGNFMSRFGYTSEKHVQEIIGKMKQEKMPFDAVIFDLFWFGDSIKGTLGNLDWVNRKKWPNPPGMIQQLKQQQLKTVLIAEPFFLKGTKLFNASQPFLATDSMGKPFMLQDFYFGVGGLLDVFKKDAGDWIWKNHYQKQLKNGVVGWWTDLGEPEKHPSDIRHDLSSLGYKRKFGADEIHNLYGHYWNKMLFEHYQKDLPNQRLFHLNRSGFAGSQRFSIFPWSGDVSRSWSGYRSQLKVMLGMSMSGIPYTHADAGGFAGGDGDEELYVRWLQFAAFTPIFRPHGTALGEVDPNAFSWPSEPALVPETIRSTVRNVINLRYAMLPYNYTLAFDHTTKGWPLVAPLYFHFPKDTAAANITDEYMWGNQILVAPIIEKNMRSRSAYLPEGNWYPINFENGTLVANQPQKGQVNVEAPLDRIPFFAKEGAFLPMVNAKQNVELIHLDTLVLHYFYSERESIGFLYWDDGYSKNNIPNKQYDLLRFIALPSVSKLELQFAAQNVNNKKVGTKSIIRLVVHGLKAIPTKVTNNGKLQLVKKGTLNNPTNTWYTDIEWKGRKIQLDIKE